MVCNFLLRGGLSIKTVKRGGGGRCYIIAAQAHGSHFIVKRPMIEITYRRDLADIVKFLEHAV